jgi:hypothetical protein
VQSPTAGTSSSTNQLPRLDRNRPLENRASEFAFVFAWPEYLRANVVTTRRLQRTGGVAETSEAHWSFSKSKHERGGLIRLESVTVNSLPAGSETSNIRRSFVTSYVFPDFQVDSEGQFVSLVGAPRAGELLRASTVAALPQGMNMALADKLYAQLFSDDVLSRTAANHWSSLVSGWKREGTLRGGQELKITNEVSLPMVGTSVTFENIIKVVGSISCETETPARCVWIEAASSPKPAALEAAYARMREQNLPEAPALSALGSTYRTEIVIEPSTLIPHWYRLTKVTAASFGTGSGVAKVNETEERTDWFQYEPGAAAQKASAPHD